ncbi:T9SS type A sorting domain-containing protein [Pontibacter cellulosilyticus]|uniref:T9SS type A sorting domain-containing protein n=1 Tax=Pontibacter cellulosilyticus TaxID=1720253 RepID=A0A923N8B3_9BACT|nr:T9SS type A sorting domain-containing protein [Pontibacter cellulosilyticus]MBC5994633.1 T9SS type A sorting domain-containing protein [Pontibacter cellulosilyticus]
MKYNFTQLSKVYVSLVLVGLLTWSHANAQVSMGKYNTYYSQNFDLLPNQTNGTWASGTEYFTGWQLHRTKPAYTSLTVNTGTSNTGGLYSYGASGASDRALGSIGSATYGEFAYGLLLQNNTGSDIRALDVNYVGEQWRSANSTTGIHKVTFWYAISSDKSSFNLWPTGDAGWTQVNELTFFSSVYHSAGSPLNGNDAANRRMLFYTLAVNIPAGHYIMLRWKDADEPEADHGLAIDDFSLTWRTDADSGPAIMPVELKSFTAKAKSSMVELNWQTASEENNDHFVVERSSDGLFFEGIGVVNGAGNSNQENSYVLWDEHPLTGTSYYRLKQVDTNSGYTYSSIVSITLGSGKREVLVYPTVTDETLNILLPGSQKYSQAVVLDVMGKQILQVTLAAAKEHKINVSSLSSGTYVLVLQDVKGNRAAKRFKKV